MGRKKLGKVKLGWRVNPSTKEMLEEISLNLGYSSGSELLDAIAYGDFVLISKKKSQKG